MSITEGHFMALVFCFLIGGGPLAMVYTEGDPIRKRVWAWFLFWASPALITLWLKGILG